jgi:hypothetical protein
VAGPGGRSVVGRTEIPGPAGPTAGRTRRPAARWAGIRPAAVRRSRPPAAGCARAARTRAAGCTRAGRQEAPAAGHQDGPAGREEALRAVPQEHPVAGRMPPTVPAPAREVVLAASLVAPPAWPAWPVGIRRSGSRFPDRRGTGRVGAVPVPAAAHPGVARQEAAGSAERAQVRLPPPHRVEPGRCGRYPYRRPALPAARSDLPPFKPPCPCPPRRAPARALHTHARSSRRCVRAPGRPLHPPRALAGQRAGHPVVEKR